MSLISVPFVFTVGAVIVASQHNSCFSTIYNDYNGGITTANISASAGITDTQLAAITTAGKVSGSALTALSGTPSGAGVVPTANLGSGTANSTTYLAGDQTYKTFLSSYVKCSNTQTSGTNGGTATSGAWRTLPLNTKDTDTGSIATLSSNQLSLPSGTYQVLGFQSFYSTELSQTRIQNITDTSTILTGQVVRYGVTAAISGPSMVMGQFTLSGTKTIEFQYQVSRTESTDGLGLPGSFGSEVYAQIEFIKLS